MMTYQISRNIEIANKTLKSKFYVFNRDAVKEIMMLSYTKGYINISKDNLFKYPKLNITTAVFATDDIEEVKAYFKRKNCHIVWGTAKEN